MASEYDEEAPDGTESNYKAIETTTTTPTTGTVDDNLGEIANRNTKTVNRIKDLEDELGIHDGMSGVLATEGTNDELPEEDSNKDLAGSQSNERPVEQTDSSTTHPGDCSSNIARNGPVKDKSQTLKKRFSLRSVAAIAAASAANSSDVKYPEDCYSFIALNGPEMGKPQTLRRTLFFLFGLLPFVFQILLLVLLAYSQTNELNGTIGETDNPDQDKDGIISLFAKFTPANSTPIIRVAQVTSLAAYVIFPDSSLTDIVRAVQLFPHSSKTEESAIRYMRLSCILRLTQGVTAIIATVLLVLRSSAVVDIILNFTAVNFISDLDDYAFTLAKNGEFSPSLQDEAERVANTNLPPCMFTNRKSKWKCYQWVAGLVALFLFAVISSVFAFQDSSRYWVTGILRVQFQDTTGLNPYSGCFEMNKGPESMQFSRRAYHSLDNGSLNTSFAYCREDRQWILFKGNASDPCDTSLDESGLLLARSSKTDTFDISAMFEESWVSASNTPLDLYFFDGSNVTDIRENCNLTLDDGRCDEDFNDLGYDFDGGDCCAATCTKSNCGRGGLTSVFGNYEVSGDGYENCADPSMVPVTIHLLNIFRSRDPSLTGWYQLSDAPFELQRQLENDENRFIEWMEAEPVSTYFSLDCNGKNVLTAYVDYTMVNQSQTVMVEDGAKCSLVVRNSTTTLGIIDDDPIWYIDYTIFHDDAMNGDSATQRVEIVSSYSKEAEIVNFTRLPVCYFRKLGNHIEINSIYTGNSSSNQAINWLLGDPDPKQQCEDSNFLERYALVKMNSTLNPTESFIESNEQCRWQFIGCDNGKIVSIKLPGQGLEGGISSEISLITNLETLRLDENQVTSLPSEIGNLSSLLDLDVKDNQVTSLPTEIGNLSSLQTLDLYKNQLTSLPTKIGDLKSLQTLGLRFNGLASVPPEIGNLKSLQTLELGLNGLTSVPPEIGNLKSLQTLELGVNGLTSVPPEIGNLKSLQTLELDSNNITSLQSEIGDLSSLRTLSLRFVRLTSLLPQIEKLKNLQRLDLASNRLTSLPPQIGSLVSLKYLDLRSNQLQSLPTQIGNLLRLQTLYLDANNLTSLPSEIGNLKSLQVLNLGWLPAQWGNQLKLLPAEIGNLTSLQTLDLSFNELASLPTEIGNLSSLQELYLVWNELTSLPTEIGNLSSLRELNLYYNNLGSLPTEIGDLSSLQELDLRYTSLLSLPTEIGNLTSLQTLNLHYNLLQSLPTEIGTLSSLNFMAYDSYVTLPAEVIALCESPGVNCSAS